MKKIKLVKRSSEEHLNGYFSISKSDWKLICSKSDYIEGDLQRCGIDDNYIFENGDNIEILFFTSHYLREIVEILWNFDIPFEMDYLK